MELSNPMKDIIERVGQIELERFQPQLDDSPLEKARIRRVKQDWVDQGKRIFSKLRVLEYGCGTGETADALKIEGYESHPQDYLKMPEGGFDIIICIYLIEYTRESMESHILKSIKSKLNQGGKAYIAVKRADPEQYGNYKDPTYRPVYLNLKTLGATYDGYRMYLYEKE